MFDVYLGTTSGVVARRDGASASLGLEAERVSSIHASRDGDTTTVLAGTYGNGLFRSTDGGRTWSRADAGLTASAFCFLAPFPGHPAALLAGTEPARIFRSDDGGSAVPGDAEEEVERQLAVVVEHRDAARGVERGDAPVRDQRDLALGELRHQHGRRVG